MSGSRRLSLLADALPGLLFAVALTLYAIRLEVPSRYIYDEVYHAYTAGEYARGNPDAYLWNTKPPREDVAYMWNHPPAGVLLIAGSILLWGDNSYGWRFASALFGAAGIALAYALALRMTRRRSIALLAACLLLADGLYFVQSRTGMLDIFGTVFLLAALLGLHAYLSAPVGAAGGPLALTGAFLGLAVATKWNAAYPAACVALLVVVHEWRGARGPGRDAGWTEGVEKAAGARGPTLAARLVRVAVSLALIPGAVYLGAYVPFFLTGHDLGQFVELQRQTLHYHTHLRETHAYASRWWEWPLALRPVWYHVSYLGDRIGNIYANGNPILALALVPAALVTAVRWVRARDPAGAVIVVGFFGTWLPWALVRRISFAYHFLPATAVGAIAVAAALAALWSLGQGARIASAVYAAAVILAFVFFYPIYAGVPLTPGALDLRMWLPSWR